MSLHLLSDEEVADLTGYAKPSYQAAWLSERGIQHFINAKGEVKVLLSALAEKPSQIGIHEPDFSHHHAAKKRA